VGYLGIAYQAVTLRPRKVSILYEVDHRALLDACRSLPNQGYRGKYYIRHFRERDVSKFPEIILKLNPTYVVIDYDNVIIIEMMGGMSHVGIRAYPENYKGFGTGDKKLIEGLWYCDDGYREEPDYEQYIESLRPKKK
jgi:hypothetical protein